MRDIAVTLIVFGAVPFIFMRPYIGILVWSWLGYMNPHRLAWGFAYNFPFSQVIGVVTIVALFMSPEKKRLPLNAVTVVWLLLIFWMCITTLFALNPEQAVPALWQTLKIQLVIFMTLLIMNRPDRLDWLIWTIVLSLGFYGIKGGLFSILTGGSYRVWGPEKSFIADNNTLALALIMTLPLMRYLHMMATTKAVRWGLVGVMMLTGLSILTSFSRGAFLAAAVMLLFLWWRSPHRLRSGAVLALLVPFLLAFMVNAWFDRMSSLKNYEEDASAMGRITAWQFAIDLASVRITGGGYETFYEEAYRTYAEPSLIQEIEEKAESRFQDAHSIYFEVLGEHGFIGLALFILLGILALKTASWIMRNTRDRPELAWANKLAAMLQISLIGYATGGAFLGLAYYDLYYHLVAVLVLVKGVVQQQLGLKNERPVMALGRSIVGNHVKMP